MLVYAIWYKIFGGERPTNSPMNKPERRPKQRSDKNHLEEENNT